MTVNKQFRYCNTQKTDHCMGKGGGGEGAGFPHLHSISLKCFQPVSDNF